MDYLLDRCKSAVVTIKFGYDQKRKSTFWTVPEHYPICFPFPCKIMERPSPISSYYAIRADLFIMRVLNLVDIWLDDLEIDVPAFTIADTAPVSYVETSVYDILCDVARLAGYSEPFEQNNQIIMRLLPYPQTVEK